MLRVLTIGLLATLCAGFSTANGPQLRSVRAPAAVRRSTTPLAAVVDIGNTEEFDDALAKAGDSLVVVDYSTSWCGPCKTIAPKFDAFSEQYTSVSFLKVRRAAAIATVATSVSHHLHRAPPQVMGDSSPEADKLMRSQGVRALPSFHFWKNEKKLDSISGAKTQALQDAIEANM